MIKQLFLITIITMIPFSLACADEFTKHDDSKINLVDLDGMVVNEKCKNDSLKCFKTLMALKKSPQKFIQNNDQKGSPASDYCKSLNGKNEILKDKNNNDWEFCELKSGIMIDSWALYKRFKE